MKNMHYAAVLFLTATLALALLAFVSRKPLLAEDHTEVVLRQIGHRLLWHAGDSTSRVLPVEKKGDQQYQLRFEQPFRFVADSLMQIVQETMKKGDMPAHYIVEVVNCGKQDRVLSFETGPSGDLQPCVGRRIQTGCYIINIRFIPPKQEHLLWILPLGLALFTGAFMMMKKPPAPAVQPATGGFGMFHLDAQNRQLIKGEQAYTLTDNETQALEIFTQHIHETVTREELMKTIWEDKGLIVIDRNVDVLVSKLRKKLAPDPTVKIINVHGRGYKMIIEA